MCSLLLGKGSPLFSLDNSVLSSYFLQWLRDKPSRKTLTDLESSSVSLQG
jgi:hypothetical protein